MRRLPLLVLASVVALAPALGAQQPTPPPANAPALRPSDSTRVVPSELTGTGPNGATLRCRDGSYPAAFAPESACDAKGGVLVRFRLRGRPGPLPQPAATPAAPASLIAPPAAARPDPATLRIEAPVKPDGATLLCRDGTYVTADTSATRCARNGGVKVRFRPERGGATPPAAP